MPDPGETGQVYEDNSFTPVPVQKKGSAMFKAYSPRAKQSATSAPKSRSSLWDMPRRLLHLKRSFTLFCVLAITCMLLSANLYMQKKHDNGKKLFWQCNCSETSTDTITPLRDNKTFIISPYYDSRDGVVIRTLGIIHHAHVKYLYCYFCCAQEMRVQVTEAQIDIHKDRFGFPFGLADIICKEPPHCRPDTVYIDQSPYENISRLTEFKIQNREHGEFTANFTVCISTLYGNGSNALQFIQTIEMYKLLGAQKVTIYVKNCSCTIQKILDYYSREGTIEVVSWPIQRYLRPSENWLYGKDDKDIGYYGQISTLNDCLYKNMYKSKFVLLNDIDEIILPYKQQTWDGLMESLLQRYPNTGVFLFQSYAFPQTIITDGNFSGISSWRDVPGFNILQHVNREPVIENVFNAQKMIVDPRKVIQTSVHSVLKGFSSSVNVPLETALVHHCRSSQQSNVPGTSHIEDKTIWKYNASLITNVNQVLSQIFI